jgi:hypothetical protein
MPFRSLLLAAGVCTALLILPGCGRDYSKTIRTFPMGERVQRGHLIYTVFETQWMTQLGEGANTRVPQHRFFLVRVSIVNSGSTDVIAPSLNLVDETGQTIPELSNGDGVPQWIGYLRNIKPAESAAGNLLFDAPPKRYNLRVSDETEEKLALIDIPLTFGGETSEMPTPGEARK